MAQVHRPQSALQLPHSQQEVCREGKEKHSHMVTDMGLQRQRFLSKGKTAWDLKE